MNERDKQAVQKAVKILRQQSNFSEEIRVARMKYADQMELQLLVGNPENDATCITLAGWIVEAFGNSERQASHRIGAPLKTDADGGELAHWFDDYKTPPAKDDAADLLATQEGVRP